MEKQKICSGSDKSCPDTCDIKHPHYCKITRCDPFWRPIRCGMPGAKHQFDDIDCIDYTDKSNSTN